MTVERGSGPSPGGSLRFAWFDGILEGPRGDDEALRAAERRLAGLGVGAAVETEGGRFSLLVDDGSLEGARFAARREHVLDALEEVVAAAGPEGEVESTLRLTEVHADGTRELLFTVVGHELRTVWRDRPTTEADLVHAPRSEPLPPELAIGPRNLGLVLVAFLLLSSFVAWRSGWVGRLLAADAAELQLSAGPFEGLLELHVTDRLGRYEVQVVRGAAYPADAAALQALRGKTSDLQRLAAVDVIASGGVVFLRLEREDGGVLAAEPLRSAVLLHDPGAAVEVALDGRLAGRRLALALDGGP